MEILPNELLFECFSYLDALHIYYAFDELNTRFSTLIRSIPLYIDFIHISTQKFCKIYIKLASDVKIKKQIYSLKITNKNPFHRQIVESIPHIDEFIHLQSLSLIDTGYEDPQWNINFSSLPELHCFHTTNFRINNTYDMASELPMSQMRILTLPSLSDFYEAFEKFSSITNLTISHGVADAICYLLKYATKLRCLHWTGGVREYKSFIKKKHIQVRYISTSLKQLTIEMFEGDFAVIARILKCTPYLTTLTLINYEDEKLFSVYRWQSLIRFSLRNLTSFNFTCTYMNGDHSSETQEIFQRFQTDFWVKKHQWYTECMLFRGYSKIYTIPYIEHDFELISCPYMYSNETIDRQNIFPNVKKLEISVNLITHRCPYYFSNVTSLEIADCCLTEEYLKLLKVNVNLTNLTNLYIASNCIIEDSSIFLEFFKQSPYISLLSIEIKKLLTLLDNDQLCEYLSRQIKKLELKSTKECTYIDEYVLGQQLNSTENKLWKTFACIEQLQCEIKERKSIQVFLESLSNLSYLNIYLKNDTISTDTSYLEKIQFKVGKQTKSQIMICAYSHCLRIWIINKSA